MEQTFPLIGSEDENFYVEGDRRARGARETGSKPLPPIGLYCFRDFIPPKDIIAFGVSLLHRLHSSHAFKKFPAFIAAVRCGPLPNCLLEKLIRLTMEISYHLLACMTFKTLEYVLVLCKVHCSVLQPGA
jgi:hypothetical protein